MTSQSEAVLSFLRVALFTAAALLPFAPHVLEPAQLTLLTEFFTAVTLAMMWNTLAGYANIVTIGQHALVGVGAYAFYGFAVLLGLNPTVSILMSGLTALLLAIPQMTFVFRLRNAYFSIGTWVIAHVFLLLAGKLPGFGGGGGTSISVSVMQEIGLTSTDRAAVLFEYAYALALVGFVSTFLLLRSRFGIGLTAMRDDEQAASAVGVGIARIRVMSFLYVAPFLGLAGALIALQKVRISPEASFSLLDWTGVSMFIVIIGGIVYFALRHFLADFGEWYLIALGAAAIVIMIIEPGGLWAVFRRWLKADIFPVAHAMKIDPYDAEKLRQMNQTPS